MLNNELNNIYALRSRGETYRLMGKYNEALADFNKLLEIEPGYELALGKRGETNFMMAIDDLTKSLTIEQKNVFALSYRGSEFYKLKIFEESFEDLNKTIAIEPKNA
ncbi:hypothetical protein C2G38_2234919 [Gigaspora rosea]|uniref:Uncharacterized protein n=1 Tax=Gigaspora rosea TaxID=44941 RepID=A0A397TZL7_9GLOM|nr:hypothetical protein C2G38_2234919 [Gigaspora rosea]